EEHPDTATSYNNVAANLNAQGKYAEAAPLVRKALEIWQRVLGEAHPDTARSYHNVAANLNAQGKYAEAELLWSKAAEGFETSRVNIAFAGIDRATIAAQRSPLAALAAIRARLGRPAPAWRDLEAYLARGLLDDLSARKTRPMTAQELYHEQRLVRRVQQLDAKLSALLSAPGKVGAPLDNIRDLERQRDRLILELKEFEQAITAKYGVAAGAVYNLESIQKQLPADTALLTWVDFQGKEHEADPNGEHWACVVRHQGEPVWIKLPGGGADGAWTSEDDNLPNGVRELVADRTKQSDPGWQKLVDGLYRQRLEPVEKHLGQIRNPVSTPAARSSRGAESPVRRLVILPSSWMRGIPVEVLTDKYTISYAPSGTLFAWLREQRKETRPKPAGLQLLALGDPKFPEPPKSDAKPPTPGHGVLITQVVPGSNAAKAKIRRGDVLLAYADKKLEGPQDLTVAIEAAALNSSPPAPLPADGARGEKPAIELAVWREGEHVVLHVPPGKLGVGVAKEPAPQALETQRAADQLVRGALDKYYPRLRGTRGEVEAIAWLFPHTKKLLGAEATERTLQELADNGELKQFRYLHLATHGEMNTERAMLSSLILADERSSDSLDALVSGKGYYDGRLTAAQMIRWQLDAELVTLSACQTALGRHAGGEGYLGFSQALLLAGARSLVLSLWKVDDTATALLMIRFYQNLLGKRDGLKAPMPKAEALAEAKRWLRGLKVEEVERLVGRYKLTPGQRGGATMPVAATPCPLQQRKQSPAGQRGPGDTTTLRPSPVTSARPYEHPYYWSAFILIGDPG
ncbi:MAG: CHAT domain-containing protein, partial [Planctomycetes bacterium]|nr:CHAT domain-containing protein [Planctomycetota bacterium]